MSNKHCEYGEIITAQFQVECDRCGHPIRVGEKCRIVMDPLKRKAFFIHLQCPTAHTVRCTKTPVAPAMRQKHAFA